MGTECTTGTLHFQAVARRTVQARFDGGALTSDGGAVLLREVDRATGILAQFAACFRDHRDPTRITLRADSGFCRDALMTWAETHEVDYVFGLAKNARLTALIPVELAAAAALFARVHATLLRCRRAASRALHQRPRTQTGACLPRISRVVRIPG